MIKKIKFIVTALYHRVISKEKLARIRGVEFGKECHFMTRSWGGEPYLIKMGDYVRTASGVKFITHDGAVGVIRRFYEEHRNIDLMSPIIIGNNVFIGMDSILLPGVKVEDNVIIGAKSVVRGHLKANSVYAGIPAKYICTLDEYIEKNREDFIQTRGMTRAEKKKFLLEDYKIFEKER
jgi:acetyltransferase-like isoleucine patch superfamily enzyme